jgi:hypothetical protein
MMLQNATVLVKSELVRANWSAGETPRDVCPLGVTRENLARGVEPAENLRNNLGTHADRGKVLTTRQLAAFRFSLSPAVSGLSDNRLPEPISNSGGQSFARVLAQASTIVAIGLAIEVLIVIILWIPKLGPGGTPQSCPSPRLIPETSSSFRNARGGPVALQNLKIAMRVLVRSPLFTLTAAVTIALGIGASTAIFSVTNAVLLQPLSYKDADRQVFGGMELPQPCARSALF